MWDRRKGIIPGAAIDDVYLGMTEDELVGLFKSTDYSIENRSDVCRVYHEKNRHTWISTESRKVYQIMVSDGYDGCLFGQITVGSKIKELKVYGTVYCTYETFPVYLIKEIKGICFETKEEDVDEIDEDEEIIEYISVYDPTTEE